MRDPSRIPDVLAAVERVWREHPDIRFFQLIDNLKYQLGYQDQAWLIEDDRVLRDLKELGKSHP